MGLTRRRRALALTGLALLLGALAASDVAGRESRLRRGLGPTVPVLVARQDISAGDRLDPRRLAVRRAPARYAPADAFRSSHDVAGLRASVQIPEGADVSSAFVGDGAAAAGAPVRPGERIADVVATGSPDLVTPGSHVDVLVTREGADGAPGSTTLALEDVEVLSAAPATAAAGDSGAGRVAVSLRVTLRQAVYLAAAQSFARELRVLPRATGDRRRGATGLRVSSGL